MSPKVCERCGEPIVQKRLGRPMQMHTPCREAQRAEYWRKRARAKRAASRPARSAGTVATPSLELARMAADPRWRADLVQFSHWAHANIRRRQMALSAANDEVALATLARHSEVATAIFHAASSGAWETPDPWWTPEPPAEPEDGPAGGDSNAEEPVTTDPRGRYPI